MAADNSRHIGRRWYEQAPQLASRRPAPPRRESKWSRRWIFAVATVTAPVYLLFLVIGAVVYPFVQAWPGEQE
ncbi:hypothetical protein PQ455_09895 [Sphingomonas naphthae]|uniref:Uncharacterized protein n=1 Tax=Sphingomonas naphthae TaxID=1813468 RepID=A0ABY7TGK2_9SPHN|nr:hypothetical protein [Sphingomonas naphthae]WCT71963.1 hypothetical protein PQ455_09895 [Sphingomonas naphthae]